MTSEVPAVLAGIAAGIILIFALATNFPNTMTFSNERIKSNFGALPEVQAFYESARIYNAKTSEQFRQEGNVYFADYEAVTPIRYDGNRPVHSEGITGSKDFRLHITRDSFGNIATELECVSDRTIFGKGRIVFHATADEIMGEQCLDRNDPRFLPSKLPYLDDPNVLDDARTLPEVLAFREKYPSAIEVIWNENMSDYVEYVVERLVSGNQDSPIKESEALHLLIRFDDDGSIGIEYRCGEQVTSSGVLEAVKTTECVERP